MKINITDEAQIKLKELIKNSKYSDPVLRLLIALDESKEDEKNTLIVNEIKMQIDKEIEDTLRGDVPLTINYYKSPYEEGFIIDNGATC